MSRLRRWLDYILEGGWLLAVVLITLYFNIYTKDSRIFEPQKALVLRTLVTFMLAAWAVRTLDENRERLQGEPWWRNAVIASLVVSVIAAVALLVLDLGTWQDPLLGMSGATPVSPGTHIFWALSSAVGTFLMLFAVGLAVAGATFALRHSWKEALRTAMVIPALAYVAVHIISTIGSVFPQASLLGGYVRGQGTLTVLAYIGLFFILAFNLRRREQLNRLITVILLTSIPSALYGVVQKFGIDPLPWMGNVEARVASTMGNAIFIAAYLIMILPLTGYRLLKAWREALRSAEPGETPSERSRIFGPVYPGLLWGGIGLVLLGVFVISPISIAIQTSPSNQQAGTSAASAAELWQGYTHGLLFFGGAVLLTITLPALIYTLISLTSERRRPYAYLAGLAAAVAMAAILLLVPETRINGLAWAGYLGGLCGLALLSRSQHIGRPWGRDALWADSMYILIIVQSLFLFVVIQQYLPTSPYATKWWVYLVALFIFLASCYVPLGARVGGRVGYMAQVGGYALLAGLQLTCIVLTQSRGPLAGLLVSVVVFVMLILFLLAWNERRVEAGGQVRFWRLFAISGGEVGRALAFSLLLVLSLVAVALVALGVAGVLAKEPIELLGVVLAGWLPMAVGLAGLIVLVVCVIGTGWFLYGPGLPRSLGSWLVTVVANLFSVLGIYVAMGSLRRGRRWLWLSAVVLMLLFGVGLAILNLPHTPLVGDLVMSNPQAASFVDEHIAPLKNIPYFGRLGRMFDASSGTGRVRILIWFGDEIGTGSNGLIFHNPLRTLIGYGPETMHVAYNPYYPPELAHVEKRNASPDRAHDAVIDELVTLGALGLAGYFLYFLGFFVLAWRLIRRAPDAGNQILTVALFALGVAHFVETLFGIPIVSTRMYMWIAIGMAVALTFMPPFLPQPAVEAEEETGVTRTMPTRRRRRSERFRAAPGIPGVWKLAYAAIGVGALLFVYRVDIKPMAADIYFWQSKQLQAQADAYSQQISKITDESVLNDVKDKVAGYEQESLQSLFQSIYLQPQEDFYFLSLAQVYLDRARAGADAASQDAFYRSTERAILRARDLSPLNTDHYRNLSALYIGWFGQSKQPERLVRSIAYGEQALSLTSNNADLHNRLAQAYLTAAVSAASVQQVVQPEALEWVNSWEDHHLTSGGRAGDTHLAVVAQYRQEARDLLTNGQVQRGLIVVGAAELQYSLFLDAQFADTYQILGDLYRTLNMPAEAAVTYATGIPVKPEFISDSQLSARLTFLSQAKQLAPVAQAYQGVIDSDEAALARTGVVMTQANRDRLTLQIANTAQTLGYVQILRGDNGAAIQAYEKALAIRATFEAYKNLGILYELTGQYEQAAVNARKALGIAESKNQAEEIKQLQSFLQMLELEIRVRDNPTDYQGHADLVSLFAQLRRNADALEQADLAAQYAPADSAAAIDKLYAQVGASALQAAQNDVAEQAFERLLERTPQDFTALYGLAKVYAALKRTTDAVDYAQRALRVAPEANKAEVQAFLDQLQGTP